MLGKSKGTLLDMHLGKALPAVIAPMLLLAACTPPPGKAELAAKVYDQKITVPELDAELKAAGVANATDPRVRQEALQRIILRKLMARAAHEQKLDEDPSYLVLKRAATESFDANLVEKAAVQKAKTPALQDAAAFVAAHPEMFAQRTVYLVDAIRAAQPPTPDLVEALRPAKNLDEAAQVLTDRRVPFRRGGDQIDTLKAPSALSLQIAKSPGEVFLMPAGGGMIIAQVKASKVVPVAGPDANAAASTILTAQAKQKAVDDAVQGLLTDAKGQISYGPGFGPAETKTAEK